MTPRIKLTAAQKKRLHVWRHAPQRPKTIKPFKGWGLQVFKRSHTYRYIHSAQPYELHYHLDDLDDWMRQTWESWNSRRSSFETFSKGFTPLEFALCLYTLVHANRRDPDDVLTFLEVVSRDILQTHDHPERFAFFLDGMVELATLREHIAPGNLIHAPLISTTEAMSAFFLRRELCWVPDEVYKDLCDQASALYGTKDEALDVFLTLLMPSESSWGDALIDKLLDAHLDGDVTRYTTTLPVLALATGADSAQITRLVDSGLLQKHDADTWHWDALFDLVSTHDVRSIPWLVTLLRDSDTPSLEAYPVTSLAQTIDDEDFIEALLARMLRQSASNKHNQKLLKHLDGFPELVCAKLPTMLASATPARGLYHALDKLLDTLETERARRQTEEEDRAAFITPHMLPAALTALPWHGKTRQPELPVFWRPLDYTPLLLEANPSLKLPLDLYDDMGRIMMGHDDPTLAPAREAIAEVFDEVSLSQFCWALFEAWQTAGSPAKHMWVFHTFTRYGAEELAQNLPTVMDYWLGGKFNKRGESLMKQLDPTHSAFMCEALEAIMHGAYSQASSTAHHILEDISTEMSALDAIDAATPTLGLDHTRHLRFDTHAEPLEVTLDADLEPHIRDHNTRSLDPTTTLRWSRLTRRLNHLTIRLATRLERALITQRRWTPDIWDRHIRTHPLLSCLAERLVWGTFDEEGRHVQTWRIDETRALIDLDDKPIDPRDADATAPQIGLVHPLHLTQEARSAWLTLLADYEIIQPFEQIARTFITAPPSIAQWKAMYGRSTTHDALHAMFVRNQWHALPVIYMTAKIPGYGIRLKLADTSTERSRTTPIPFKFQLEPGIHKTPQWREERFELVKCVNLARLSWDKVDPIAYSELWRSMHITFPPA